MKKIRIEYEPNWKNAPMAFWVHRPVDVHDWQQAQKFSPEAPTYVPDKGYPIYYVELDGFVWVFSSIDQIRECLKIIGEKILPTTKRLSEQHWFETGPNSHWLGRLPGKIKSWKYRERAVKYLSEVLRAIENNPLKEIRTEH